MKFIRCKQSELLFIIRANMRKNIRKTVVVVVVVVSS